MPGSPPSLDDLSLLVEIVARGGVTAAARPLGLRKSTVSRRLAALEERLGVRLVERGGRGLALTEAGRAFHAGAARIVAEARRLEEAATVARATPQGTLRVAAPALLAEILAPVLAELLLRHPALGVEVALEQHGEPGAACDLALRMGPLADSGRVARRLGELRAGLYARARDTWRGGARRTPRPSSRRTSASCSRSPDPTRSGSWARVELPAPSRWRGGCAWRAFGPARRRRALASGSCACPRRWSWTISGPGCSSRCSRPKRRPACWCSLSTRAAGTFRRRSARSWTCWRWCAPCKALEPILEALAADYAGRVRFARLDVERARVTVERFGVRAMPTLLLFRRGCVVQQLIGAAPRWKLEEVVRAAL